ncbi:hypothetical protein BDA99DRAFT_522584 [Phascolomyces articulosus]|uniref:Uncharacterized protein n=1 Tax=Phascolomyces articulosus TaxID=60185 RepID=A0AAD5PB48_9FUNG|nr:hypothetical protein BDA99DRAFT_522584 [Phascolomyces articulosus]
MTPFAEFSYEDILVCNEVVARYPSPSYCCYKALIQAAVTYIIFSPETSIEFHVRILSIVITVRTS